MKKLILITIIILITYTGYSYAGMDDKSDRLSNDQAGIFSPGYINASMQKTENIINQSSKKKSLMENITDYVKNKLSNKVTEDALDKPVAELKKKTGATGDATQAPAKTIESVAESIAMDPTQLNLKIGSGTNQYKENGRIIYETIGGKKYVYAGFSNVGKSTIQDAINKAISGDTVVVKAGIYPTNPIVKNGVNLYGGYNEQGVRDIKNTPTIINGSIGVYNISNLTEINGFTIKDRYVDIMVSKTQNLIISNNTFYCTVPNANTGNGGITLLSSSIQVKNNNFYTANGISASPAYPYNNPYKYGSKYGSNVLSESNNFFKSGRSISVGLYSSSSVVSSKNDYFADVVSNYNGIGGNVSITNRTTTPNLQTSTTNTLTATSGIRNDSQININPYSYNNRPNDTYSSPLAILDSKTDKSIDYNALSPIFKGLLANKQTLQGNAEGQIDPKMLAKIVKDSLGGSALAVPQTEINPQEMDIAIRLANIMKNPTEDQKAILDAMTALLNEVNKEIEGSDSPELKKVTDDLLQMVATILIAQAIPDLLKEGDVSNIKGIFKELTTTKGKIFVEYQETVKPYYEEMKKIISKNLDPLQLNNIVSKGMMEKELAKLEPNEIDKILEKLRSAKDKSFEAEYILQEEGKLRKAYIDPSKKVLEDKMKDMMREFTGRLSRVLESTKK